jgi:hypothetical protein
MKMLIDRHKPNPIVVNSECHKVNACIANIPTNIISIGICVLIGVSPVMLENLT